MQTRAIADGSDYLLRGSKHFISSHKPPDFAIVFAATGEDETARGPRKRVTAFLLDVGTPGFEIRRGPTCTSHRGYHTYELSFDDCRLPAGQILGAEGKGLELANEWLHMGRVWVAAGCCGRAERLLELASGLGRDPQAVRPGDRQAFKAPASSWPTWRPSCAAADLLVMNGPPGRPSKAP